MFECCVSDGDRRVVWMFRVEYGVRGFRWVGYQIVGVEVVDQVV